MNGCRKKSRILQLVTFLICVMFWAPGRMVADEEDDGVLLALQRVGARHLLLQRRLAAGAASPVHKLNSSLSLLQAVMITFEFQALGALRAGWGAQVCSITRVQAESSW